MDPAHQAGNVRIGGTGGGLAVHRSLEARDIGIGAGGEFHGLVQAFGAGDDHAADLVGNLVERG